MSLRASSVTPVASVWNCLDDFMFLDYMYDKVWHTNLVGYFDYVIKPYDVKDKKYAEEAVENVVDRNHFNQLKE